MQKIYLLGATWYVWWHILKFLSTSYEIICSKVKIQNYLDLEKDIISVKPDIIINAAWMTGKPNVDSCESNKEDTLVINVAWSINVASISSRLGIYMVQIGSWCIYSWNNDWRWFSELDPPNFFGSVYSRSKILSEKAISEFNVLQLRIRIPIEGKSNPKNVINKLLSYPRIISVDNSFTIIEDFLVALKQMICDKKTWIYNMTNIGYTNHSFIMNEYKRHVDISYNYNIMTLDELKGITKAERSNCILNVNKRESEGYHMPDISLRIPEIMTDYKNNNLTNTWK